MTIPHCWNRAIGATREQINAKNREAYRRKHPLHRPHRNHLCSKCDQPGHNAATCEVGDL